ncbi:MAG: SIMPL domain-containing protein [Rhodobacteraceae bacterium]|nr:SIMPL domain-containing protein [Paracoccaceae bacterium]
MRLLVQLAGFLILFAPFAMAEEASRTISVTGQGQVEAKPDMATITLGTTSQARQAGEALAEVSAVTARVFTRLEAAGIAPRDMQTSNLNLHPLFSSRSSSSNEPPKITGFSASNMITIRVRDLASLGRILDQVAEDGANEFNGLRFGLQVPEPLQEEARVAAVKDGMARAALLAEAAGVELGPVLTISDGGGGGAPVMMARGAASFEAMPVASGELSISASVNMVFAIGE